MRKWMFLVTITLLACVQGDAKVFFLSPPRTGTHWMMYSIGAITGRYVSFWHRFPKENPLYAKIPEHIFFGAAYMDQSKDPILHTHYPYRFLKPYMHQGNKLLMIARNHKEYLLRRTKENSNEEEKLHSRLINPNHISGYMNYFKFFEEWEEDKRLLVYYEDMMHDFENTMDKILAFIGEESGERLERFVDNIDYHRGRILKYYHRIFRRGGGSISKGKDVHHHSKDIPVDLLQSVDTFIKKNYPNYWRRYLKRYETK